MEAVLFIFTLVIVLILSRWIFRINDIVSNLENINKKLSILCGEKPSQTLAVNPDTPCEKCGYKPLKGIVKVDGAKGAECPKCRAFYPW